MATTLRARERIARYRDDPVAFCREALRFELWSKQAEVIESVRDHTRTAVRSCHGAGKTAVAARVALWFLVVHPRSRVITTAPTFHQVRDLLWREVAVGHRAAAGFIGGELFDTRLEIDTDWFAIGLSTDRPERFQGHHAEHLLLVVDEASGVSQEIFEAAAGFLTSPGARALLVGNPTKTSGEFFDAFHSAAGFYNTIKVSAFDTPAFTDERVAPEVLARLVSRRWVEEHTAKWGVRSPLYEVRIAAEFPSQADDAVVPLGDLHGAQGRELEPGLPLVLACDVARFGSDDTAVAVRRGNVLRVVASWNGRDTMQTTGEIVRLARELHRQHERRPLIVVDDAGVGGGVVDRLRELGEFRVVPFLGAGAARDRREYPNARSQSWFDLAEALPQIDLDPDPELAADLLAPRYTLDSQGRRVVEPKSETKRRLRRSPDRADAVAMALSVDPRPGARAPTRARWLVPHGRLLTQATLRIGPARDVAVWGAATSIPEYESVAVIQAWSSPEPTNGAR
jgi:hypothetical protein